MCSKCVSVLAATEKVENIKKKQQQQIVEKCVGCALSSAVDVVPRSAAKISAGAAKKKLFGKRSRPILKKLKYIKEFNNCSRSCSLDYVFNTILWEIQQQHEFEL